MRKHLFRYRAALFCTVITIVVSSILSVLLAFVLKNILDLLSINADASQFYRTILYSGLFIIFNSLMTLLKRYVKALYIKKVIVSLKNHVFNNIANLNITKFNSKNSGNYVSNLTNDIKLIEGNYLNNVLDIFDDIASFLIAIIALVNLNIYLAAVTAITSVIPLLIPKFTHKRMALLKHKYSQSVEDYTAQMKDIFTGYEVMKSYNLDDQLLNEFTKKNYNVEQAKYNSAVYESGVNAISTFLSWGVQITTIIVGVFLARKGLITVGTILATGQLMNYIVTPITQIAARVTSIKSTKPIIEKIENLAAPETGSSKNIVKKQFEDRIEFQNVTFSYDGKENALHQLNLEIQKGKKYAIVGHSGSGKSTILKLLLNYYTDYSGEIRMDDIRLPDLKPESLYEIVSIIHQNVFLFDTTLKENITLYQQYSEETIQQAIQHAGLSQLVNSLEERENTHIGEAGNRLSGGEKQRIAIARALVRKAPILMLDEATAALDNAMAHSIEKSILNLNDITALVITHKLSRELLMQYDQILVLRNGELVEQGSFVQLMNNKKYFYSLYYYDCVAS